MSLTYDALKNVLTAREHRLRRNLENTVLDGVLVARACQIPCVSYT